MRYLRNLALLIAISSVVMVGCTTTNNVVIEDDITDKIHPDPPRKIKPFSPVLYLDTFDDGELYVYMSYKDSQYFSLFLSDTLRYIKESNDVICFYRKSLNDENCER